MKPIDPSEPLYPIRPTEPPCQYFLKHGTCKFGQSCKFNHPTESPIGDVTDRCLSTGRLGYATNAAHGASAGELSSRVNVMATSNSVQVLPQRPTEPNCIYFLRNGKCKYGATCKFHHPLGNRNNQVQHMQLSDTRQSQNMRDGANSAGPFSDGRTQVQHGMAYATAANVAYVQSQRLQSITERVRPQEPTHILLPDGKIAVIFDPQSLQNVKELDKFYLSKTHGSIDTLKSTDQKKKPADLSPILTATTNSTSNMTVDSSIDLMGTHVSYRRQGQGTPSRGPTKSNSGGSLSAYGSFDSGSNMQGDFVHHTSSQVSSKQRLTNLQFMGTNVTYQGQARVMQSRVPTNSGSGGSLSAYGSLDSCLHTQGDFVQQVSGQVYPQQRSTNVGQASNPQYGAWPMSEGIEQLDQVQEQRLSHSYADAFDRQCHAANDWPSNDCDIQGGINHDSRRAHLSLPASAHEHSLQYEETSENDQGLSMMTSALLTMMDHNLSEEEISQATAQRNPNHNVESYYSHIEPNLHEKATHIKPPPGMSKCQGSPSVSSVFVSNFNQDSTNSRFSLGGGYFVGGYDMPSSK